MKPNLNYDINEFIEDNDTCEILIKNNILTVELLWKSKRKDLKEIGLTDLQINKIIIKLQLLGLDLNKKIIK